MQHYRNPAKDARGFLGMDSQRWQPNAESIAEALEAKRSGAGRWMARCPSHADKTPSLSIKDDGGRVLVHCFGGCLQDEVLDALRARGLWPEPGKPAPRRLEPTPLELEREAIRHAVLGTLPNRLPPYSKQIPHLGDVTILAANESWPRRPAPALVLPPSHPPAAYKWPVAGRRVHVIDLTSHEEPGYFHYGAQPWRADPWQWTQWRREWLKAWALVLIQTWGAAHVRVVSQAGKASYRREVRYAA